jgi:hypothetical protein
MDDMNQPKEKYVPTELEGFYKSARQAGKASVLANFLHDCNELQIRCNELQGEAHRTRVKYDLAIQAIRKKIESVRTSNTYRGRIGQTALFAIWMLEDVLKEIGAYSEINSSTKESK